MNIILRLAWRNLWRHPRRTALTVAAIGFAVFLLVFMVTIQLGAYDMMIDNSLRVLTGHFQVQQPGYLDKPQTRNSIPRAAELAAQLRGLPGVRAVAARAQGFALVSSTQRSYGAQVLGVEVAQEPALSTLPGQVTQGRYLSGDGALEAVLGEVLARNLKLSVGDEITLLGSGRDGSVAAAVLPVVGIFRSGMPELDRGLLQIPLRSFQNIFSMDDAAHSLVGVAPDLAQLPATLAQVRTRLDADPASGG